MIFYACIAGQDEEGSALLNELSRTHFPDCHVIGFERFGVAGDVTQPAGTIRCHLKTVDGQADPKNFCSPTATNKKVTDVRRQLEQLLSEYAIYAKWSFRGKVIKIPFDEVIKGTDFAPRVICGPDAVMQALNDYNRLSANDPKRPKIDYVAMNTKHPSRKFQELFMKIQTAGFQWSDNRNMKKKRMIEFSPVEREMVSAQMGKLKPGEELVAVLEAEHVTKYRCAWAGCPGHREYVHFCKEGVPQVPNNPLE